MSELHSPAFQTGVRAVFKKAIVDAEFRARAQADAALALREVGGMDLPTTPAVHFVEKLDETALDNVLEIQLPPFRASSSADDEISDADLDVVAGGSGFTNSEYCSGAAQ